MLPLDGAKIKRVPTMEPCTHKSYAYRLVVKPPFDEVLDHGAYQPCWRNEFHSLVNRHLKPTPKTKPGLIAEVSAALQGWVGDWGVFTKWSPEQVVNHKQGGGKRRRYQEAFKRLSEYGLMESDYIIRAFIKLEKVPLDALGLKPPRLIQYRSFTYCAALSQYLAPIEQLMWGVEHRGLPVFMKGRTSTDIAITMRQAWDSFIDPIAFCADHSSFDASVREEHILLEIDLYKRLFPGDPFLVELLSRQLRNRAYTKNGIAYACHGRKMSGEYNTSLGDSVINYGVLRHIMGEIDCRYFINGDDSVIIMESSSNWSNLLDPDLWAGYGFRTRVDIARQFGEIDFCQCRPIEVEPASWRMIRLPWRAVGRSCVSVKRYQGIAWRKLVKAMGLSEIACSDGVPMLQAWGERLIRIAGDVDHLESEIGYKANLDGLGRGSRTVTNCARMSFYDAFGIDETTQLAFEDWCSGSTDTEILQS